MSDLRPLGEDVFTHTMTGFFRHADDRPCMFHNRLGVWTPDGFNERLRSHASPATCPCGCPEDMHIGEIGCPCALPGEPPCEPARPSVGGPA